MPNWTKEQQDAINKDNSNIIVSAGAGSGKTAVLSERVLRKIKDFVDIDKLLILTFTNAAAEEMKERIRKKLIENKMVDQLTKLDSAYITTFDAYALGIVKKYNYLLNISKNISICEPSIMEIKKQEIMDEAFLIMYNDIKFLKLIDDFCSKDDQEIKKCILDINSKLDMIYNKEEYLNEYINNYFCDKVIDKRIDEYINLLHNKISLINLKLIELEEYVDNDYYIKISSSLEELLISKDYKDIKSNIFSLPSIPKNSDEQAKKIKEVISEQLKELKKMCNYESVKEIKESILKTKENVEVIINIIKTFDKKLNSYKFENDLYEFIDISKMAIKLLENHQEVKKELKYNEILIDEYQDTNDLQDLFISLIEDNNVYMVGDIKQSIYRFRNANPDLFKKKYDDYSLKDNGIKIDLNKNFRSREEVLNNINLIFNIVMDDTIGGADYEKSHQMTYGNVLYSNEGKVDNDNNLEILSYEIEENYKKSEMEIFIIANDIINKINTNYQVFDKELNITRKIKYSDISILMDRATDFDLYKKIFEYKNIPLTLYKDELVNDNIDINIIKNIICFMIIDDIILKKYSFVSILRSYLFNIDDSTIFNFIADEDFSFLNDYIFDYNELSLKDIIECIINKYDFYNKVITVGDIDKHIIMLDYIVDLADNLSNIGYNVNDFYSYLQTIVDKKIDIRYSLNNDNNDSVRLMTIHKSKGLEYKVCYYSGLTSKFNIAELKDKFSFDRNLGIITPFINNGIRSTIYEDLLKNSYLNNEISEKIRLFYVALTRAQEKMIIVLPKKEIDGVEKQTIDYNTKMNYKSLSDILYSILPSLVSFKKDIDISNLGLTHDYNLIKKYNFKNKINIVDDKINLSNLLIENDTTQYVHFSKENNKLYSISDYENIEFGNYMHKVFEEIDFNNPDYSEIDDFVKEKVIKFIKNFSFSEIINIYKELEFIYNDKTNELHGFIDLLLEYPDHFKIVDHKLKNTDDSSYINQLHGYKKYIEKITNKKAEIYLYSIIEEKLIEIK